MTTKDEALIMALEALEDLYAEQNAAPLWKYQEHWQAAMDKAEAAMPAIREALASEANEQPTQQEPVCDKDPQWCWSVRCQLGKVCKNTSPPIEATPLASQRSVKPWVGLTDDDLKPVCDEYRILFGGWVYDFARAIEAKLKEKNDF